AGVGLRDFVGLVDLNGRMEKVVDFPESESGIGGDAGPPAPWSPDGANLAFVSNVHDHLDIGVLKLRRRRVRWLVQSKWDKSRPLWSPDGKRIAFLENRDGNIQLKTISPAGRGARAVSSPRGTASHAVWHPKGQGLFYLHSTFTRPARLIAHLGGTDMEDIIAGGRWLVKNGYCAPDRLGAIGTSYGGYAVAHILEKAPDLWAVGVIVVGYFNWMTATTNERGSLQRYDRQKMG